MDDLPKVGSRTGWTNLKSGFAGLGGGVSVEYPERLNEIEKRHIEVILKRCKWNITESAEKLGIHRNTLAQKIKDYGLKE